MDIGCNCFGVATAAKVPVKRYNLLVPAIFPVTEPSLNKPLGIATEKNIKRIAEYLERNEHRIPKVSRRLSRRLHSDLGHRKLGFVRVAVATFQELLAASAGQFARIYAKELVCEYPTKSRHVWSIGRGPAVSRLPPSSAHMGSVVGVLLADPIPQVQMWGLELLLGVIRAQDSAEFVSQMEGFVPLLCVKAAAYLSKHATGTIMTKSSIVKQQGSEGKTETTSSEVSAGSLRAILEHLRLCARISYVSRHLDTITYAVLGIMEADAFASGATYATAQEALAADISPKLLSKTSIGARVGGSAPGLAALLVYQDLGHMTRDAAEGKKVLDFLLRFLDARQERWVGGPALDLGLGGMRDACKQEHQRYLLASTLVCHAGAAPGLSARQRTAVMRQAMKDAEALDPGLAMPILLVALHELPEALVAAGAAEVGSAVADSDVATLEETTLKSVTKLSSRIGDKLQLTSVLAAALGRLGSPSTPLAVAGLRCCAASASAYRTLPSNRHGVSANMHISRVLLQSALAVCLQRPPSERVFAHAILQYSIAAVPSGPYPKEVELVLSSLYHESMHSDNTPACFVSMAKTLDCLLATAATPEAQLQSCQMILAIQRFAIAPTTAAFDALQRVSLLYFCSSQWVRMAERVQHAALSQVLCPLGLPPSLPSLQVATPTLELELGPGAVAYGRQFTPEDETIAATIISSVTIPVDGEHALAKIPVFGRRLDIADIKKEFAALPLSAIEPNITLGSPHNSSRELSVQAKKFLAVFNANRDVVRGRSMVVAPVVIEDAAGDEEAGLQRLESQIRTGPASARSLADVLAGVEAALKSPVVAEV